MLGTVSNVTDRMQVRTLLFAMLEDGCKTLFLEVECADNSSEGLRIARCQNVLILKTATVLLFGVDSSVVVLWSALPAAELILIAHHVILVIFFRDLIS
mmetsp:Transcript_12295/g.19046  ORF Transcript_12295/g.19046 Transcript_12295/m.19046 type:complete len:99 (+) Transcript_12295:219-515(+)